MAKSLSMSPRPHGAAVYLFRLGVYLYEIKGIVQSNQQLMQVATTDNGFEVHEHMWSNEVFTAYVDKVAGEGCWKNKMQPRMEQIVTWSLLCAQVHFHE